MLCLVRLQVDSAGLDAVAWKESRLIGMLCLWKYSRLIEQLITYMCPLADQSAQVTDFTVNT